ncbi:MAG: hypothetical protein JWO95_1447, partial [Verrucomicrobiales bacterium]|nr:hypothetical protein [Verrucomicrobiales bacterium]
GGFVGRGGAEVFVETVVADVGFAADEPLGVWELPLQDFAEGLEPNEFLLGDATPEFLRLLDGFVVEPFILGHRFDVGLGGKLFFGRKNAGFLEHGGDVHSGRVLGFNFVHNGEKFR